MRIYADFNALVDVPAEGQRGAVRLDRMGTLRDLCAAKLRLQPALKLTLYTDSDAATDLEIEAAARWLHVDPANPDAGVWVAEFDPAHFREVPSAPGGSVSDLFPCSKCDHNLAPALHERGLRLGDCCPACGTPVHAPISAPDKRA